ncbi:acyl-CoA thioesterase [Plasticicumulans acidivorans]|uniref:Acyl-CoA thioester hydrolase n=1 Tax=Plasticicumulans acidivorans TaxID=886464 RepID=A0A317MVE1_9GAMM|nr:thioesterase family protein [Plasticicumulans acidivorans]PWV58402.1 acyl-CoA thioester hydrolase [Plasticicumulans acidivorans]
MQRADFRHFFEQAVRWGDLDALGHVNNVQFIRFLESGRVAYVEDVFELPVSADGEGVILADLQCSFLRQLEYPDTVEVATRVSALGGSSFELLAAIFRRGEDAPVATSRGVLVWFDFRGQSAQPLPEVFRERIRRFEVLAPRERV